jgi:hypothetical protein
MEEILALDDYLLQMARNPRPVIVAVPDEEGLRDFMHEKPGTIGWIPPTTLSKID